MYRLPSGALLCISSGNIVRFSGDAIVNAANNGCLGGGGVDGAITAAGGPALAEARRKLPIVGRTHRCETGDAKITIGGALPARWCIHAVGPIYTKNRLQEGDAELISAYNAAMCRAGEKGLKSIAFSLISSSIFRGEQTLARVLECGLEGIDSGSYEQLEEVHMMAFTPAELRALSAVCDDRLERVDIETLTGGTAAG